MKKFILATGIAIVGVALSIFVAYIAYLDKCLEDDEANDGGNDSKSDNKGLDKNLSSQENKDYEFDTKPYMDVLSPPYEDNENPAPDENISESYMRGIMAHIADDLDD